MCMCVHVACACVRAWACACVGTGVQLETPGEPSLPSRVYCLELFRSLLRLTPTTVEARPHEFLSRRCCAVSPSACNCGQQPRECTTAPPQYPPCSIRTKRAVTQQHSKLTVAQVNNQGLTTHTHVSHPHHCACLATHSGNSHRRAHARRAPRPSLASGLAHPAPPPRTRTQQPQRPSLSCNCAPAFAWQTFLSANPSAST